MSTATNPTPTWADVTAAINQAQADQATAAQAASDLATSQSNLATVTAESNAAVQAAQTDLQLKTAAAQSASAALTTDEQTIDQLVHAVLNAPVATPPALQNQSAPIDASQGSGTSDSSS